jgi:dienelactone hydrolase
MFIRVLLLAACLTAVAAAGDKPMASDTAKALAAMDGGVLSGEERAHWAEMIEQDVRLRLHEANRRDSAEWAKVRSKADWERFRDQRVKALRACLGVFPDPPKPLAVEVTGRLAGDGHRVENLVFQSRPGLVVTANLYLPAGAAATAPAAAPDAPVAGKMPGILLCHSHHNPKTEGELQDMGVTWARAGCMVLVMDQLGHGERRQQPFGGRQDYRSRFYTGMQLHLLGDSLIGWMAWDLIRGVDLLLGRPGIDPRRIIAIGSVAGGGDPVAVAAAIDPRIACAVPFNFGGPQPETAYPLPADAEEAFNYAGWGSFESTRNLSFSARDGFLPWEIVAAVAPRGLIYGHEFAWDGPHDPVWRRLASVWGFYGAAEKLGSAHGFGNVNLRPPAASHCNNVGPAHRKEIYPYLERWFGIPAPKEEHSQRRTPAELACLTDEARAKFQPKPVHELAAALAAERVAAARAVLEPLSPADRRKKLRGDWARLLGGVEPPAVPRATVRHKTPIPGATGERVLLQVEERIVVPAIVLVPQRAGGGGKGPPVVVAVAEEGKDAFLKARAEEIAALLAQGVAVCLPDLRGCGQTSAGDEPGRHRKTTDLSSTELMLGQTMLGSRLRDLRAVLRYLRSRTDLDAGRIALWGEALSPVNDEPFEDQPESAGKWPHEVRPLGGLAALLGALFEDDVRAVVVRRGLVAFQATLDGHFCYIPHDTIVPAALTAGDLADLAAALAPRPLRMEALVDGRNRPVADAPLRTRYDPTIRAYAAQGERLILSPTSGGDLAAWLAAAIK